MRYLNVYNISITRLSQGGVTMRDLFRTVIRKFDCLIIKKRKRLANDFRDTYAKPVNFVSDTGLRYQQSKIPQL